MLLRPDVVAVTRKRARHGYPRTLICCQASSSISFAWHHGRSRSWLPLLVLPSIVGLCTRVSTTTVPPASVGVMGLSSRPDVLIKTMWATCGRRTVPRPATKVIGRSS